MTRSERSRELLFSNLDGLCETGRITEQQRDTLKIYARYWVDDMVAEAMEGAVIVREAPAYDGPERRQGGRVPLAVRMKRWGYDADAPSKWSRLLGRSADERRASGFRLLP